MTKKLLHQFRYITLHTKTALLFSFGLIGVVLSCLLIIRYFFLYSLDQLEDTEVRRASHQAEAVIGTMVNRQKTHAYDWAYWDETYLLLTQGDEGYKERNLYIDTLNSLDLDLMGFLTKNRQLVMDVVRPGLSESVVQDLLNSPAVQHHLDLSVSRLDTDQSDFSDLISLDKAIWVVTVTPVRNSEATSEVAGWMIWGQYLTKRFPGDFASLLTASNTIVPLAAGATEHNSPDLYEGLLEKSNREVTYYSEIIGNQSAVIGYLKTRMQRTYYQQGNGIFIYLIGVLAFVTGGVALITFLLFRSKVGKQFSHFERDISQLLEESQLPVSRRRGKDEFDHISNLVRSLAETSSQAENRLQETLGKFDALYHSQSIGMVLVVENEIADLNQAITLFTGYQRDELTGQPLSALFCDSNECSASDIRNIENLCCGGERQYETCMRTKSGEFIPCQAEMTLIQHNGQKSMMLSVKDISEQKQQAELIENLSQRDLISGLLNRPTLVAMVEESIRGEQASTPFAVLYFCCDRLQEISEVYGHNIYDVAVRYIADSLSQEFETGKIGRISEHEFMVFGVGADIYRLLEQKSNRLLNSFQSQLEVEELELELNIRGAILGSALRLDNFESLVQSAFYATHSGKGTGGNAIVAVSDEMVRETVISTAIYRDIPLAIRRKEFVAHYQPIVGAESGRIVGFEALARWNHESYGMIAPSVFVPMAEKQRLEVELGKQILEQACRFIYKVNANGGYFDEPYTIHVNVSSPHFYHKGLVEYLSHLVLHYQLAPGQLVLEMTESILLGSEQDTIARMARIKQLGIQLALDDFGTGYSSFSSLCDFPLDIVKLDRSYIVQLENNEKAKTLVRNILHMSQELGLTTVAEGVETASQLRKLRVWHVDEIQGYYFYKPMPEQELLAKLAEVTA